VTARDYAKGKATATTSRWPIRGPRDERMMTMDHRTGAPAWWTAPPRARACRAGLDAGRASHNRVDVGVVPHVEGADGAGSCGDCENSNGPKEWIEMAGCNDRPTTAVNTASGITRRLHQRDKSR
jgi:hypothetical protein